MGRKKMGRATWDEEQAWMEIAVRGVDYVRNNWHKLKERHKIQLFLKIMDKRMPIVDSAKDKGDVYLYNDFRSKARDLGADGIRHLMRDIRAGVSKV